MVQYFLSGISIALNQQIHKNEKHEKLWWLRGNVWQLRFLFCGHWAKMLYEIAQVCWPFAELWRPGFSFSPYFSHIFFLLFGSPQGAGGAFSLNAWETAQLGSWVSRWARWAWFLWVSLHIWLLAWFSSVGQIFAPAQRVIIINNDGNFTCWKSVFRFAYYYCRPMFMFSLFRQIHQLISRACGPLLAIGHWELETVCTFACSENDVERDENKLLIWPSRTGNFSIRSVPELIDLSANGHWQSHKSQDLCPAIMAICLLTIFRQIMHRLRSSM